MLLSFVPILIRPAPTSSDGRTEGSAFRLPVSVGYFTSLWPGPTTLTSVDIGAMGHYSHAQGEQGTDSRLEVGHSKSKCGDYGG